MSVIKDLEVTRRAGPFNLADIALEAKGIITRAERQAEQIIADARVGAEEIRNQARQTGHQEGLAAGQEEGRNVARDQAARQFDQQIARTGRALAEAVEQLAARKAKMLAEARQDLVALALAAAEKVVRSHLAVDPDAARRTVEAAVELAGRASRLSIRVHPNDLEAVQAFAPQLAARLTEQAEVQVAGDEAIESGGCRLVAWRETGQASEIDAEIQTQLTRLTAELLGQEHESGDPSNQR